MKTVTEIRAEIHKCIALADQLKATQTSKDKDIIARGKREINKHRSRIAYLNEISLYLKSEPTLEFCERELQRLTDKIKRIDVSFDTWKKQYFPPKPMNDIEMRGVYRASVNYGTIQKQIDNLKFILEK